MFPLTIIWAVLATAVLVLIVMRKVASRDEDDNLHVNDTKVAARQSAVANTLDLIDRWGVTLTVVVVVYGFGLLGMFLYSSWQQGQHLNLN